jgi:hypothetical protein
MSSGIIEQRIGATRPAERSGLTRADVMTAGEVAELLGTANAAS